MTFVKWFLENVAGDYGCCTNSVWKIPKEIRVIFFELDSLSKHIPILLRQIRQRKLNPLVVLVTPDDKTRLLGVDGYWEPSEITQTPVEAKTTLEFLIDGTKKYLLNDCVPKTTIEDPTTQVNRLLEQFLEERQIKPTKIKKACRMKFAELTDILKNRAIKQGFHLLPVLQKDIIEQLKAKDFKIIRPQGTLFFKYTMGQIELPAPLPLPPTDAEPPGKE